VEWHTFRHTYRPWLDDTEAPVRRAAEGDAASPGFNDDERVWERFDGRHA
jgi:hypothetical protein